MTDTQSQIDSLRGPGGRFDRAAISSILPYGDEFLFVDEVTLLTPEQVVASYTVPKSWPLLDAHFVGAPLMPGVLMGEGMAQAGTLVIRYNLEDHHSYDILAFHIESARFTGPARPGDRLDYRVRLTRLRRRLARLEGEVENQGRKIVAARVELAIVERDLLLKQLSSGPVT
jgi:3-hydroxymyristoyl/3-hydroxydecanoyl-(acyl carrier protein) dehydratase